MDGHLCSVGSDVYQWDENFMPTGKPTVDTFKAIKYNKLTRATTDRLQNVDINLITTKGAQHMSYVPLKAHTGISYGDNYWYNADGQLWIGGGSSSNGANCGLASAHSVATWTESPAAFSARLAVKSEELAKYFGQQFIDIWSDYVALPRKDDK